MNDRPTAAVDDVIALNERVATLELELDAYAAHASGLQARLLSTLDTLQQTRLEHAEEVEAARRREETLEARVTAARKVAADAEAAQEDMRAGVLLLVEKVEVCNDYSLWPHSGLIATSLASEPIAPMSMSTSAQNHIPPDSFRAYAKSMIVSLRAQAERDTRMRAELQNRVNLLEALLAQRDLELELAAAPETCAHCAPSLDAQRLRVSRDEAIRLLETSATRNRALTEEISILVQRLEQARAARSLEASPEGSPTLSLERDLARMSMPSSPKETSKPLRKFTRPPTPHHSRVLSSPLDLKDELPSPTPAPYLSVSEGTAGDASQRSPSSNPSRDVLTLQQECEGLRIALYASQQEVNHLRASQGLFVAPSTSVFTAPSHPSRTTPAFDLLSAGQPSPALVDLLTDSDNGSEMSMDLASPLQPTLTMLRGSDAEPVLAGESNAPNSSESRPSRPLSPLLPHLTSTIASTQPSDPDVLSIVPPLQRAASVPPLSMPVFTLRPTPPFQPSKYNPSQATDDTAELARVRDALESAQGKLEAQDRELAAMRRQLLLGT
ncbi:hypothetical protein PENSPDRAFT_758867 [Peniophora sp. CONT]|nr:hypothetical protein PENSPDRAFT_758867 [Peniophora sp. CONT]